MAVWVPYLTESIGDGVDLATAARAGLGDYADILSNLDGNRLRQAPREFARLIAHLLRGTDQPFWAAGSLADFVREVRDAASPDDIETIIEEATRLGCFDATQW